MRKLGSGVAGAVTAVLAVSAPASATWSIVGVDVDTGEVGVAVASCVGFEVTSVPVLVPGVGAAASQADLSEASGERIVEAMVPGASAGDVIDAVVAADDRPDTRQFGVVVLDGTGAGWSGAENLEVAIDRRNPGGTAAAQGNVLVSDAVVDEALAAFDRVDGDLTDRLVAALVAGADAGGDRRCGDQTATAAALLVARPGDEPYAQTDASVFGVDTSAVAVPSVFVSVLVAAGGDRAPDRLASMWSSADRAAGEVLLREVDDGADTAAQRARTIAAVILAASAIGIAAVALLVVRARRRAKRARADRPN